MRWLAITIATLGAIISAIVAQTEVPNQSPGVRKSDVVDLALPTDNDAIFQGGGPAFYQYINRDYRGQKTTPWEGGQYGFVRDPVETAAGIVYTRFHEGIDIRPLLRDENGEPRDEVRAIADGRVVYTNPVPRYSNYGKYIVIEHHWNGSPYYTLYGHLSVIATQVGQSVQRGTRIAIMGYTGEGINRERAHLHLELNLMLSRHFEGWYNTFHHKEPNHHGIYNGINLAGLDIARLYLALREDPSLTIPNFLAREEVYYEVALPNSRYFELPKTYPWMVNSNNEKEPKSWTVSFARSGLPLKIEPNNRRVKHPEIVSVKQGPLSVSDSTYNVAEGSRSRPRLTDHGKQLLELLIWPD